MNYKVIPVDKFKKEAKRLIKNTLLLKSNWLNWHNSYLLNQHKELNLEMTHIKFGFPLKVKGKVAGLE